MVKNGKVAVEVLLVSAKLMDGDGHCGLAVSVSESLNTENLEKFLCLAARYALKTSADVVGGYTVGIADIATAPVDALASMAGPTRVPRRSRRASST